MSACAAFEICFLSRKCCFCCLHWRRKFLFFWPIWKCLRSYFSQVKVDNFFGWDSRRSSVNSLTAINRKLIQAQSQHSWFQVQSDKGGGGSMQVFASCQNIHCWRTWWSWWLRCSLRASGIKGLHCWNEKQMLARNFSWLQQFCVSCLNFRCCLTAFLASLPVHTWLWTPPGLDCDTRAVPWSISSFHWSYHPENWWKRLFKSPLLPQNVPLLLKQRHFFSTIYNSRRFFTSTEEGKTERPVKL